MRVYRDIRGPGGHWLMILGWLHHCMLKRDCLETDLLTRDHTASLDVFLIVLSLDGSLKYKFSRLITCIGKGIGLGYSYLILYFGLRVFLRSFRCRRRCLMLARNCRTVILTTFLVGKHSSSGTGIFDWKQTMSHRLWISPS